MKNIPSIIWIPLLMLSVIVHGQNSNIVSKDISKTIQLKASEVFKITGEKAYINLTGWDKPYAELKIRFSAEHPDKKIAQAELEYMHYSLSREKNMVELQNAFLLPARTDRIQSRVKVSFDLMMPRTAALSIYNKYGDVEIHDLSGILTLHLEFSDLLLNNVSARINLQSSYSSIRGDELSSSSFISHDEESKFALTLDKGSYAFNSKHGDIDLTINNIRSLAVNATHTDITIQPVNPSVYNYQLVSREGKIFVPRQFNAVKKENNQSRFVLTQALTNPLIDIKTTFNTITIQ